MQPEDAEIQDLLHQLNRLFGEMLLVADKGEDHANGQRVVQCEPRRKVDRDDILKAENDVVERAECYLSPAQPHVAVDNIAVAIKPLAFPLTLAIEQFQALYRTHALYERRILFGLRLNG